MVWGEESPTEKAVGAASPAHFLPCHSGQIWTPSPTTEEAQISAQYLCVFLQMAALFASLCSCMHSSLDPTSHCPLCGLLIAAIPPDSSCTSLSLEDVVAFFCHPCEEFCQQVSMPKGFIDCSLRLSARFGLSLGRHVASLANYFACLLVPHQCTQALLMLHFLLLSRRSP